MIDAIFIRFVYYLLNYRKSNKAQKLFHANQKLVFKMFL